MESSMVIEVILFGFFMTCAYAGGAADVVLSCTLVEEGVGMGEGSALSRSPATLVFRDIEVGPDESLEMLTPFIPPSVPDPDAILFESKVSSPEIPNADVLLHADCNELEVMCEISRYSPQDSRGDSEPVYFMVSIHVKEVDFSTSLILQTLPLERDQSTLTQSRLGLPLSQTGTLLTDIVFLVFSNVKSVSTPLREDILLDCGFKQQESLPMEEVAVEWRQQYKGKGRRVLSMSTRPADLEGSTVEHNQRGDSSVDATRVVEGNASMTLSKVKVMDEGTYICTVKVGLFHAQQVIQLQVTQPPHVSISNKLVPKKSTQTISCHCVKYYPLDAEMEWLSLSPTDTEPTVLVDHISLSSHRQHSDGTYSLSSHYTVPPSVAPGTKITCHVSHPALDAPLSVSVVVESPKAESYWWVLGFLIITVLFFYQVMR